MSDELGLLEQARRSLGLGLDELWIGYFALGGMGTSLELEAYLLGALVPSPQEHDRIAVALNEHFSELGAGHPVPYASDDA